MHPQDAERRAQELAGLYDDYDNLKFYLKCVYRLSEGKIQYIVESAGKAKDSSPRNYFKAAAKQEMAT